MAPFKLGDEVIKYSAIPCTAQVHYRKPGDTSYYLEQRLQERLDPTNNHSNIGLYLQVQFRNDPPRQPIENTLVAWDGNVTGWHRVAKIEIYPQAFSSTAQQEFCERLTFNPYHGLKVHEPLGSLNHARRDVMQAMQNVRLKANGLKRSGPHKLTGGETFN